MSAIRTGITPNTVMQMTEHGSLIFSYETPLAAFVPHDRGHLFFYSKECKTPEQTKVSATTRRHLRKYQQFYGGVSTPIPLDHSELVALHDLLRESYKHTPQYIEAQILGLCQLYVEN